nr:menaquinone biosynthesis protein [uncultured Holophaga sp.]
MTGFRKSPFRVSIIEYLNAAPLNFGFKQGLGGELFELRYQVPSVCADQLRSGEVDAALISSIEYLRIPGLRVVPGLCIASPKRVRSVLLMSKVPVEQIRTLALDTSSRSSVALVRILLRGRHGMEPKVVDMAPDLPAMMEACDAAVMIGDAAMKADKQGLLVMDLAEEWHAWTGLPFVFALWTVRQGAPELPGPGGVGPYFHRSLEMGRANLDTLVEEARRSVGWTAGELREYFTENISYSLGMREREGLALFYEKAVQLGFAPGNRSLCLL